MEQSCPGTVLPWNIPIWYSPALTVLLGSVLLWYILPWHGLAWYSLTLPQFYPGTVLPWYSPTLVHSSMVQSVQSLSYHGT